MKTILNSMLFDMTLQQPVMVQHLIREADDGTFEHTIDNKLRATIPGEHFKAYLSAENMSNVAREIALNKLAEKTQRNFVPFKKVSLPVIKKR